jgi:hypothetical protein
MCGIFGVVARRNAPYSRPFLRKALGILMAESQSRGKDSSGLAFRDERAGRYQVFKGPIRLDALVRAREVSAYLDRALASYGSPDSRTFAVIGHSRLVTNGSQLRGANNQPVIKDGILGIHNGIIVNDRELWTRHADLAREHEIDTEVLLAIIRKGLRAGASIPAAIACADAETEGTVSTALLFTDIPALALATNNGSLYTLTNGGDLLLFASEEYPLRVVAKRMRVAAQGEFEVRQISSWSGLVLWFDTFALQSFTYADAGGSPAPATPPWDSCLSIEVQPVESAHEQLELVRDVAGIACAPEAARGEALLEHNRARIAGLRRCAKCILPETFPFIEFDEQGICNYCANYRLKNQPKPLDELLEMLKPYRRTDGKPDCIVPFSGGRDSTYALHTIKTGLKLDPIAFTYDWGMVTDLGRRNIARVCGKLGVENIIVAADIHRKRRNIQKNITAWLKNPHLGMIPLFMAGDKYFYYYTDRVKKQTGIALNIWGINPLENTDFKVGFMGVAPDFNKKRIYSLSLTRQLRLLQGVGRAILSNRGYLNSSVWDTLGSFVSRSILPHTDYFHLYDYVRWDEQEIDRLLLDEYRWETAVDTRATWRIGDGTAAFYNYIYYTVAGFSEHDTFRSNQIREGAMMREEALARVNEENRPRYATIRWYTDVVKIDFEHAITVINAIPKLYP